MIKFEYYKTRRRKKYVVSGIRDNSIKVEEIKDNDVYLTIMQQRKVN